MENYIEVKNLHKKFKDQVVLDNVSFSIKKGTINGLLGPNGSGKTTIIRLLNGVINANEGEIKLAGFDAKTEGNEIRKIAGIVTESASLYHEMSAWDNLVFFSNVYGVYDEERILYLLEQFEMLEHKDKLVGTFSTGMKKRVALAKALLHKPSILFLDEPTNGLDPEGIQLVVKYLDKIKKEEGITILICSHVLQQLESICDSYIFIQKGKVIEQGTKRELEDKYLKSIHLLIETGLNIENKREYKGYPCKRINELQIEFIVPHKDNISELLQSILQESWVHSCEIADRNLESLYFAIRGEKHE